MSMKLKRYLVGCALVLGIAPAYAQTGTTPPPPQAETTPQTATTPQPGAPAGMAQQDMMREMMREMMTEMMQEREAEADAEGDEEAENRGWGRWHDGRRMGRRGMMEHRGMMDGFAGHRGRHGAGMRIVFAIMDADGNGSVSLQEAQDFQARIFRAVDDDGNGEVSREEIRSFFHGRGGKSPAAR